MLGASFFFAAVGAIARILSPEIPTAELVLFRNMVGVVFILWSIWQRPVVQSGGKLGLLVFRGIMGTMALYLFFYAISQIGLAEAITYQQSYPLFIAVFSIFLAGGERLSLREYGVVLIGFGGVFLIFLPQFSMNGGDIWSHSLGLVNAIFTALAYMSIRLLSSHYDARIIVLSFMLSGIIIPLATLGMGELGLMPQLGWMVDRFVWPDLVQWIWLLALGLAALIGQLWMTKAFALDKAGMIAAVGYSNILFSIAFGFLLGDHMPGLLGFMGIMLVIMSGVLVALRR